MPVTEKPSKKERVFRTETHTIGKDHEAYNDLMASALIAGKVRNEALRRMLDDWNTTGKWSAPKTRTAIKTSGFPEYSLIPTKVTREIVNQVSQDLQSYARAKKTVKNSRARLPKPTPEGAPVDMVFQSADQLSAPALRAGEIRVGMVPVLLAKVGARAGKVSFARVRHTGDTFIVEIVYSVSKPQQKSTGIRAGLDLGINNLAAVLIDKPGIKPLLLCGKEIKAVNQRYNKLAAKEEAAYLRVFAGRRTWKQ